MWEKTRDDIVSAGGRIQLGEEVIAINRWSADYVRHNARCFGSRNRAGQATGSFSMRDRAIALRHSGQPFSSGSDRGSALSLKIPRFPDRGAHRQAQESFSGQLDLRARLVGQAWSHTKFQQLEQGHGARGG